ncbi:citrate synthase [Rhodoferax koreense]|uniref:citrate synthase (unknown stereospecificity) n=2 Tax=Rhodoferax koreensis TaxID=1842727 RepID=A0A1P8K4P0_9BURK|nr:citrate synthase [Rhodoferax koreense]
MQLLNVRQQTLYAYVSRGWIRSVPQKGQKSHLYLRDDIARVGMRSAARAGHGAVAAAAMNWGEPIFPTSITEITPQGPRYRGHLAADLARSTASFETVAELLWSGVLHERPPWPVQPPGAELLGLTETLGALQARDNILETFALVVLMLGMRRGPVAERLQQGRTLPAAREIMQAVVASCGFLGPARRYRPMQAGEDIVEGLIAALGMSSTDENRAALRHILILMADHELPPGTLGARVVASAGGTLHSCLASALCATSGVEVGRMYERVEAFLGRPQTRTVLLNRALRLHAQGQSVPGFDHPLYPQGDPRAAQLLALARARGQQTRELRSIFRFLEDIHASTGLLPRQEFALVVLARAMELPPQAPAALFALGRIAGWVAHVQEQRASGTLLRPRAKFVEEPASP